MADNYDPIIADAKRRARRHARKTGVPYQTALDLVARNDGREGWSAFVADPTTTSERPDAHQRFLQAIARANTPNRLNALLAVGGAAMIVAVYHMILAYPPPGRAQIPLPSPPMWAVVTACAVLLPITGALIYGYATLQMRIVRNCMRGTRTGMFDAALVRSAMRSTGSAILVIGAATAAAMHAYPIAVLCGAAVALAASIPALVVSTILRPRHGMDSTAGR